MSTKFAPVAPKLTPQQQTIIDYMKPGRTLTNMVAITCLGIGSLSSRVAELRRAGHDIVTERCVDKLERSFDKYTLVMPKEATE